MVATVSQDLLTSTRRSQAVSASESLWDRCSLMNLICGAMSCYDNRNRHCVYLVGLQAFMPLMPIQLS